MKLISVRKLRFILFFLLIVGLLYAIIRKPHKMACAYQPYFAQLNKELKVQRGGESVGLIDLDRLDSNLAIVRRTLGDDYQLRIVTKSLPCLDLLRYLMLYAHTNKLMVFSEPFIAAILDSLPVDSLDVLLGKPLPVDAAERLSVRKGWNNINWLIDTKERLQEYLTLAQKKNTLIKISLEIDVGLHRGGFQNPQELPEVLSMIKQYPQFLQLTGLMGYDGHVPFVPFYIRKSKAIQKAFANVQERYTLFVDELKKFYNNSYIRTLTLNSGGTRTYFYYPAFKGETPVNDIAMGSGFVTPANFEELLQLGHQPALFLSSPILKKIESARLPHAEKLSPFVNWWNPNLEVSYFMIGGGWPGVEVAPAGLQRNTFWEENEEGYSNLLPNQSILSSSKENDLRVGDFVFYEAWEGDGMLCFDKIVLIRRGKLVGQWQTFRGGN